MKTDDYDEALRLGMIQEVINSLAPEHRVALRPFWAAMPLSETQESLRRELVEARDRAVRISVILKEQTGKKPRIKRARAGRRMLTVAQMAERLELSRDTVYRMCEAGEIAGVKLMRTGAKKNKTWRADPAIFERWRITPERRVKRND